MVLLAGAAGIMSAQEITHQRMQNIEKVGNSSPISPETNLRQPTGGTQKDPTEPLEDENHNVDPDMPVSSPIN